MTSNENLNENKDKQEISSFKHIKDYFYNIVKNIDWVVIILTGLLILIGLMMVFSSTSNTDLFGNVNNPFNFINIQVVSVIIGILVSCIIVAIPIRWYSNYWLIVALLSVLLFTLVLTAIFGTQAGGATSWLSIGGFNLQSSEFVKLAVIIAMSWLSVQFEREVNLSFESFTNWQRILLAGLMLSLIILIGLQPDMGMVFIIMGVLILMFMVTFASWKVNALILASGGIAIFLVRLFSNFYASNNLASENYRLNRIISFANPFEFRQGIGYQMVNSYLAFSNGGWFGVGLGNSEMKHGYLPAAQTDFIFAIIGEELGFLGAMVVVTLFGALILRLLWWSAQAKNSFRSKVLLGIGLLFFVQVVVNIGGALGLIPLTGVTLPFISAGGTSMLMFTMAIGLAEKMIIAEKHYNDQPAINLVYSSSKEN